MPTPVSNALQSLNPTVGNSPTANPSASLNPSYKSPLPQKDMITQALQLLNPKQAFQQQAQAPTITPNPTPQFNQWGFRSDMDSKVRQAFGDDPQTAAAIAMQESSLNPNARYTKNGIDAVGLMQINLPVHLKDVPGDTYDQKVKNLMNPDINLQVAKKIQKDQGWNPWQAYTTGDYKKYTLPKK